MNKRNTYDIRVAWTGNLGNGTSTYRGYARDYDIACEGKPVIKGSADPGYLGDATTAERLHERASAMCFIARSVNFPVDHEPETAESDMNPR